VPEQEPWFSRVDGRVREINKALNRIATVVDRVLGSRPSASEAMPSHNALFIDLYDALHVAGSLAGELADRLEELTGGELSATQEVSTRIR